jgi:hypothetical protein
MKKILFAGFIGMMLLPILAFAGKTEREYWKSEVEPAIQKAVAAVKTSCGCAMTMDGDDSVKVSTECMNKVKYTADSFTEKAAKYCSDAESKKAICKMKKLMISKSDKAGFELKGSNGAATTDCSMVYDFDSITPILDK